jgi:hypothetical protein
MKKRKVKREERKIIIKSFANIQPTIINPQQPLIIPPPIPYDYAGHAQHYLGRYPDSRGQPISIVFNLHPCRQYQYHHLHRPCH